MSTLSANVADWMNHPILAIATIVLQERAIYRPTSRTAPREALVVIAA